MKRIVILLLLLLAASVCYSQTTDLVYVDTDVVGGNDDGSSWENAYSSLEDAIAGEARDLTSSNEICKILLRGSTNADTDDVTLSGFTTSSTQYVWLYADPEDRHEGTYSTSKYRMTYTDEYCLEIFDEHVRVDGIQFGLTVTANNSGNCIRIANVAAGCDIRISNCIFNAVSMDGSGSGKGVSTADTDAVVDIWNCVFNDFLSGADDDFTGIRVTGDFDIWNCTIYGCYYGIEEYTTTDVDVTNCIVFECETDLYGADGDLKPTYCLSNDDLTVYSVTNQVITQTDDNYAALVVDADGGDFSLTDSSSEAVGFGDDDPGGAVQDDTDIIGTARTSSWDCGAFELSGSIVPIIVNIQNQ